MLPAPATTGTRPFTRFTAYSMQSTFLVGHGSGFTGCATDDDSISAVFDLIIDDLTQSVKVDGFIRIHRGHDGNARAGKDGLFHKLAPF